jgi:hypothetical protein
MENLRHAPADSKRRRPSVQRLLFAVLALAPALLLALAMPAPAAPGGATEAERLHRALARMAKFTSHRVRPPAGRVASAVPDGADRLEKLQEPASTAEAQVSIALGELQQMSALTYDPHYMPALVAAGRAFVAISGQDPLTRTAINPDYLGLEHELAGNASGLQTAGRDAAKALSGIKRLNRELIRAKRRAARLERRLRHLRAQGNGAASGVR